MIYVAHCYSTECQKILVFLYSHHRLRAPPKGIFNYGHFGPNAHMGRRDMKADTYLGIEMQFVEFEGLGYMHRSGNDQIRLGH